MAVNLSRQAKMQGRQNDPTLMGLSSELRVMIIKHVFSMTRLTYGKRKTGRTTTVTMKPNEQSFAILYVCRKTWAEGRRHWISRVLFNFEDMVTLLDRLCALPEKITTQIRHVRVAGSFIPAYCFPGPWRGGECASFGYAIGLVPALKLDTLTVLSTTEGCPHVPCFLQDAVRTGVKWKELYYLTPSFDTVNFDWSSSYGFLEREGALTQPKLEAILRERDGIASGGSVAVYRATRSSISSVRALERADYHVNPRSAEKRERIFELLNGRTSWWEPEYDTLIVVKRGPNVDVIRRQHSPFRPTNWEKIRSRSADARYTHARPRLQVELWKQGCSWSEVLQKMHDELERRRNYPNDSNITEPDSYDLLDEYKWQWPVKEEKKKS